ncbi:MAG: hypothetical protein QOF12_621, partial [Solirubrobacteraceae bacterium]|nr:hypothetical protein [Solirubrobacteraceae bacterium]
MRSARATAIGALLVAGLSACGAASPTGPLPPIPAARIAVVVLENHGPAAVLRHG